MTFVPEFTINHHRAMSEELKAAYQRIEELEKTLRIVIQDSERVTAMLKRDLASFRAKVAGMTCTPEYPSLGKYTGTDSLKHDIARAIASQSGEPVSPSDIRRSEVAQRINSLVSELDEMMVLAANPETYPIIEAEAIAFGQLQTRIQLILSFLAARQPTKFKVISNG